MPRGEYAAIFNGSCIVYIKQINAGLSGKTKDRNNCVSGHKKHFQK
jgi:hypothetical protein